MFQLIFRRLLQLPLILGTVFAITFVLVWMMPGDPTQAQDGKRPPPAVEQRMHEAYNLDNHWAFLGSYAKNLFTEADLGPSIRNEGQSVNGILARSLPVSAALGLTALAIAVLMGTAAGIVGALKPGSPLEVGSLGLTLIGISLPSFVTGAVLLAVGAGLTRRWLPELPWLHLPMGGWNDSRSLILPALALSLIPAAYIARLVRLGLADVMRSDFIRTAKAKGLTDKQVVTRHALKVAFLPVLSFLGPAAAGAMTGSFVIEKIFNIPGLGQHFIAAVQNKDQFVVLGVVLVFATLLVLFNLLVDIAYAWVDPRIELG